MGKWCPDCTPGKGCGIYDTRPEICKGFHCLWLSSESLPDKYKPDKIKLYISGDKNSEMLVVCVDASYPLAWREGDGKELIDALHNAGNHLLVMVGRGRTIIPGKDRPLPKKLADAMEKNRDLLEVREIEMRG